MTAADCRVSFAETLIALAEQDRRIVAVVNDSVGSSNLKEFKRRFPDRLINVGIAEQNLVGVSAGLASAGKIPFTCGASCFLTGRALEQVKADVAYSRHNVKLCGMSSGMAYGELGPTHHSIEDLAWTRALANLTVIVPADPELVNLLYKPAQWTVTEDPREHHRRSIYLIAKRNLRLPFLEVFDQPADEPELRSQVLNNMLNVSTYLVSVLDPNELLTSLARRVVEVVPAVQAGLLWLRDQQQGAIQIKALHGLDPLPDRALLDRLRLRLGEGLSGTVWQRPLTTTTPERASAARVASAQPAQYSWLPSTA